MLYAIGLAFILGSFFGIRLFPIDGREAQNQEAAIIAVGFSASFVFTFWALLLANREARRRRADRWVYGIKCVSAAHLTVMLLCLLKTLTWG